jgi:MFS family permease
VTRFFVAVIATATAGTLPVFLTGALAVQIQAELRHGPTEHGIAFGAFFACAALSSMAFGRVSERLGPIRSLRGACLVGAVLQLSIAVFARSWLALALLLGASGLVTALIQPAANLLLARAIPRARQGLGFGIKQSAIPMSTLLGGMAVPTLALTVGWRWAFVLGALLAASAAASVPKTLPSNDDLPTAQPTIPGAPALTLVALAMGAGLGAAAAGAIGAFLVSTGVHAGLGEAAAGLALTSGSILGVSARLVLGRLADYRIRDPLRVVVLLLATGSVSFWMLSVGDARLHWVATALAFAGGWAWPGLFNLAVVLANPASPGAATGITQTGTYAGAVSGPLVFGLLVERASFATAWKAMALCALLAALAVAEGRRRLVRGRRCRASPG